MHSHAVSKLKSLFRSAAHRFGYEIKNRGSFGIDVWHDIQQLSTKLGRPVEVVFDVGANDGGTCATLVEAFPNSRIFAFEPVPKTFATLAGRIDPARIEIFNLALSDRNGTVAMYEYEDADKISSLVPDARYALQYGGAPREISVVATTIDDFCAKHAIPRIDVLKIDTEGADFTVIKGARGMLERGAINFIFFEFNDFMPKRGATGGSLNEIGEFLAGHGFSFVATYTDNLLLEGGVMAVANALAVRNAPASRA